MSREAGPREPDNLTREAFERLLRSLDPDPRRAAEQFQSLQYKLILFFTYNHCADPEHCADEVVDRVARRLYESDDVPDVRRFAYGVARLVLLETRREEQRERISHEAADLHRQPGHDETALQCLDRCIGQLNPEQRTVILTYYGEAGPAGIRRRAQLAVDLGLSIEALRTRALRIRKQLEGCVTRCLGNVKLPS